MVLLSTHNKCFSLEIRKIIFNYTQLSKAYKKSLSSRELKCPRVAIRIIIIRTCFMTASRSVRLASCHTCRTIAEQVSSW